MRVLAWAFTLLAVAILCSPSFDLDLGESYSVHVADGNLKVRMWPTPRESGAPDTFGGPLWRASVMVAAVAAFCWFKCGKRAAPKSA